jgi:hypothetical protein
MHIKYPRLPRVFKNLQVSSTLQPFTDQTSHNQEMAHVHFRPDKARQAQQSPTRPKPSRSEARHGPAKRGRSGAQQSPTSSKAQQAAKHGATRRPTFLSGKWRVEVATPTFCRPAFCLQLGQILKPTHRHTNNLLPDPSTFHYGPAILILPIFCRPRS